MSLLTIGLMSCSEIFGNTHIQKYASTNQLYNLFLGVFGYAGVLFFLIKSFGHGNMMWVSTIWQGMIIVLSSLFAYFYLGERFSHPVQYLGIVLGFLAMCCVNYKGNSI